MKRNLRPRLSYGARLIITVGENVVVADVGVVYIVVVGVVVGVVAVVVPDVVTVVAIGVVVPDPVVVVVVVVTIPFPLGFLDVFDGRSGRLFTRQSFVEIVV